MATADTLDSRIGYRITELRKAHHMTQAVLAEKMDVSIKHISSVERGISRLSLEKMITVCELFDCTLDYLVLGKTAAGFEVLLPETILETLRSDNQKDKDLLNEYLNLYSKMKLNTSS